MQGADSWKASPTQKECCAQEVEVAREVANNGEHGGGHGGGQSSKDDTWTAKAPPPDDLAPSHGHAKAPPPALTKAPPPVFSHDQNWKTDYEWPTNSAETQQRGYRGYSSARQDATEGTPTPPGTSSTAPNAEAPAPSQEVSIDQMHVDGARKALHTQEECY